MNENKERVATIKELVDELICKTGVTMIDLEYDDTFEIKTHVIKDGYYCSSEIEPDHYKKSGYTILIIRK